MSCKLAHPTIDNEDAKQEIISTSEQLEKSLKGLGLYLKKTKTATDSVRMEAANELINSLSSELDDLESALNAFEIKPNSGDSREKASANLKVAANSINANIEKIKAEAVNKNSDVLNDAAIDLGYSLEDFMSALKELAATTDDPMEAKKLIEDAKILMKNSSNVLEEIEKAKLSNFDENSLKDLVTAGEGVLESVSSIIKDSEETMESDDKIEEMKANNNNIMTNGNKLILMPNMDVVNELSKSTAYLIEELEKEAEKESNQAIQGQINLKVQMIKTAQENLAKAVEENNLSKEELEVLVENLKLVTGEATDWIARNKMMKRLINATEKSVSKAEKYIKTGQASESKLFSSNDDLENACTAVTDMIDILNASIDKAKQTPGSALAQSNLLSNAREYLDPSKR